jgi:uncharacterized small protein (DUF1192 family)
MDADVFFDIINECDVLRDDIDELRGRIAMSKSEARRLDQAIAHLDKAKSVLAALFPTLKSLPEDMRDELNAELADA